MSGITRVNASMLPEHVGKLVCVVGKVTQVSPTGNAIKLLTSDQQTTNVALPDQYEDTIGHCIQIIGIVQQNLSLVTERYISFAGGESEFDLALYDRTIKLLPRYPQLFTMEGANKSGQTLDW